MSREWIQPESCKLMLVLVDTTIAPLLIQHPTPVGLELDIPADLPSPPEPRRAAEIIQSLVVQALTEMPEVGELTVTGCQTSRGIELEIADNGPDHQERPKQIPIAVGVINASLQWQNCPQGGSAVTLTFKPANVQGDQIGQSDSIRRAA